MKTVSRAARALAIVGLTGAPLLGACETIAGYDDAQPWPAEAGAEDAPSTVIDSASPPPDHDVHSSDTGAPDPIADAASTDATDRDASDRDAGGLDATHDADATTADAALDASLDATSSEAGVDASVEAGVDASPCPVITGGAVCAQVPRFTAPTQVVDGIGDEFCNVPATVYAVESAAYKQRAVAGTTFPEVVTYRIAWSDDALHIHVHVDDPKLLVAPGTDLYSGDAVVIYSAGGPVLTGAFNGTNDDGAVQILVSPAAGTMPARAYAFYWDGGPRTATVDPSLFASRIVPGGYEVEIKIPWSAQKDPNAVKIGGSIGIDPGVIVKDNPAVTGQELEATLGFRPLPTNATTTCASGTFSPWCDDRTWCVSTLQ